MRKLPVCLTTLAVFLAATGVLAASPDEAAIL